MKLKEKLQEIFGEENKVVLALTAQGIIRKGYDEKRSVFLIEGTFNGDEYCIKVLVDGKVKLHNGDEEFEIEDWIYRYLTGEEDIL